MDAEINGLKLELPDKWEYYIDRLSLHIASSGKQYNNHTATIYKWVYQQKTVNRNDEPYTGAA